MAGLFGGKSTSTSDTILNSVSLQQSTYGLAVPIPFGKSRVSGNLIGYDDLKAIPHTTTSGGKGGGGSSSSNTTYTYTVSLMLALGEGIVSGIGKVWKGSSVVSLSSLNMELHYGDLSQGSWTYMTSMHPEKAIPYRGIAYVSSNKYELGGTTNLPNLSFEYAGPCSRPEFKGDAIPSEVIITLLTNPNYGAGFPLSRVADLGQLHNYCRAAGIFISPLISSQSECQEYITEIARVTNSQPVWSQGKLKMIPYSLEDLSGNGTSYIADNHPVYDISSNDFIVGDNSDPIIMNRSDNADAYNYQPIEFRDRDNNYNTGTEYADDQASIENFGLRVADVVTAHSICERSVAKIVAQNILNRKLYTRNSYTFTLSWKYCLLEPMDLITLTNEYLGLNRSLARVVSLEDTEEGDLIFEVEEVYGAASGITLHPSQPSDRTSVNYARDPGDINTPLIFEPSRDLSGGLELWMGVSGGDYLGGCNVWASEDGTSYKKIGAINSPTKQGVLTAVLPTSTSDPDTVNTLSVDMTISNSQLITGTQLDADNYNTLCYVDGELISYRTSTLTSLNKYNLTYLRRGAYGTTISSHPISSQLSRVDTSTLLRYPFNPPDVGKIIYLKFTAFNVFGSGEQSLADVSVYQHTLGGKALLGPLPNVTGLQITYTSGFAVLSWAAINDFRAPILYEIRQGSNYKSSMMVGRTSNTSFQLPGYGTYFISAIYQVTYNSKEFVAYSAIPSQIIGGTRIAQNTIGSYDERATGWIGTCSDNAVVVNNAVQLYGNYDFFSVTDVFQIPDVFYYSTINSNKGTYTIPSSHIITLASPQLVNISYSLQVSGVPIMSDFDLIPDIDALDDWDGANNLSVSAQVQINIHDGTVWGGWQDVISTQYLGKQFNFRVVMKSTDALYTPIMSEFKFNVDVASITRSDNIAIPASGSSVLYSTQFNNVPNPVITIFNGQADDTILLTNQNSSGFSIRITNGGVGVDRNINYASLGY